MFKLHNKLQTHGVKEAYILEQGKCFKLNLLSLYTFHTLNNNNIFTFLMNSF